MIAEMLNQFFFINEDRSPEKITVFKQRLYPTNTGCRNSFFRKHNELVSILQINTDITLLTQTTRDARQASHNYSCDFSFGEIKCDIAVIFNYNKSHLMIESLINIILITLI